MTVYSKLRVKGKKKHAHLNIMGNLLRKKDTKGKLFDSCCTICFRNMLTM